MTDTDPTPPQVVWVTTIETEYGMDVAAFATEAGAWRALTTFVDQWWEVEEMPMPRPADDREAVEMYFEHVSGEYFTLTSAPVRD